MMGWLALAGLACSSEPEPPPAAVTDAPAAGPMAHGDHNPHHGGLVLMNGDLHFEVVLDKQGRHRVFFSDAYRQDLPASVARDVEITVQTAAGVQPTLPLQIDESGESWEIAGPPVEDPDATATVKFTYEGAPFEIDVPFTIPVMDPSALAPHSSPAPPSPAKTPSR